jgi:hypothetical protein
LANFQSKKRDEEGDSDEDEPDENQIEKQAFEDRMDLVNKVFINDDGDGRIYDGTKKKPKLFAAAASTSIMGNKSKREDKKSTNNNSKITNFSMMSGAEEEYSQDSK